MSTDIKLDEFAGNTRLSEGTLRGLVTRSGVAEELADRNANAVGKLPIH